MQTLDPTLEPTPARDGPQAFRWRLAGNPPPPLGVTLPLGNAVRAAIYDAAARRGITRLPDDFHGTGDDPTRPHAFWLPEDADGDGRLDHVLLFAEHGLPPELLPILAAPGPVWLGRHGRWSLRPDWMGRRAPGALFGPARCWRAATAYVTPLWQTRKPGDAIRNRRSPDGQLAQEIVSRGLPVPLAIDWAPGIACSAGRSDRTASSLRPAPRRPGCAARKRWPACNCRRPCGLTAPPSHLLALVTNAGTLRQPWQRRSIGHDSRGQPAPVSPLRRITAWAPLARRANAALFQR